MTQINQTISNLKDQIKSFAWWTSKVLKTQLWPKYPKIIATYENTIDGDTIIFPIQDLTFLNFVVSSNIIMIEVSIPRSCKAFNSLSVMYNKYKRGMHETYFNTKFEHVIRKKCILHKEWFEPHKKDPETVIFSAVIHKRAMNRCTTMLEGIKQGNLISADIVFGGFVVTPLHNSMYLICTDIH